SRALGLTSAAGAGTNDCLSAIAIKNASVGRESKPDTNSKPTIAVIGTMSSEKTRFLRSLGQRLEQVRIKSGLSQRELASEIGVQAGTVGRWERGETAPDAENIAAVCARCEAEPEWLLTGNEPGAEPGPRRDNVTPRRMAEA